jgi:transposase
MEAPLSICTKKEMRGVIRFLFAEGVKPVEIIRRKQAQYSDNCLSRSKIYEWTDHFKKGRSSVCDEDRSGRPSMSRTENSIQAIERMVRKNRQWTTLRRLLCVWPMKEALRERRFSSDQEVIDAVQNWLKTQTIFFF